MKVLYIDPTSPFGHKNHNYGILRNLVKLANVDILTRKDFLKLQENSIHVDNEYFIPDKYIPEIYLQNHTTGLAFTISMRTMQYNLISWILKNFELNNYDLIFFTSIEIISFGLASHKIKGRCVFIDHGISDTYSSNVKKWFWKRIDKKKEIIVSEKYIGDYVKENLNDKSKVWHVNHPLPKVDSKKYKVIDFGKKVIFAPSGSNDEGFVDFLRENRARINRNYKIVIKSNRITQKFDNLLIYSNKIEDEEYYEYLLNCEYVLLPYTSHFSYKMSGVFFEAAQFNKRMLINSNNTLKHYKDLYPNVIELFDGYDSFIELLNTHENYQMYSNKNNYVEDFKELLNDYSDITILEQLRRLIHQTVND